MGIPVSPLSWIPHNQSTIGVLSGREGDVPMFRCSDVPVPRLGATPWPSVFAACRVVAWSSYILRSMDFWLVVGPPLWKIWTSIGMMTFPIYGKIKNGNPTTNQISMESKQDMKFHGCRTLPNFAVNGRTWDENAQNGQCSEGGQLQWGAQKWHFLHTQMVIACVRQIFTSFNSWTPSLEDQVTEVVESTQNCSWQSHVFGSSSIFCWFSQVNSQYSMLAPTFSWSIIWTETRQGHTAAAGSKLHLNDCQEQTWHGDVAAWTCNVGRVNPNCIHMEVSWNGGTTLSSNLVAFSRYKLSIWVYPYLWNPLNIRIHVHIVLRVPYNTILEPPEASVLHIFILCMTKLTEKASQDQFTKPNNFFRDVFWSCRLPNHPSSIMFFLYCIQ